ERPDPERNTIAKTASEREPGQAVRENNSTVRQKAPSLNAPPKIKHAVVKEKTGSPPRIGQMSLGELREQTSRAEVTVTSPERGSVNVGSRGHTGRLFPENISNEQSQSVGVDRSKGGAEHETDR